MEQRFSNDLCCPRCGIRLGRNTDVLMVTKEDIVAVLRLFEKAARKYCLDFTPEAKNLVRRLDEYVAKVYRVTFWGAVILGKLGPEDLDPEVNTSEVSDELRLELSKEYSSEKWREMNHQATLAIAARTLGISQSIVSFVDQFVINEYKLGWDGEDVSRSLRKLLGLKSIRLAIPSFSAKRKPKPKPKYRGIFHG